MKFDCTKPHSMLTGCYTTLELHDAHFLFRTLWAVWLASLVIMVLLIITNKIIKEGN